jgi:putative SOS response-associated peptidase YedK
MPVILVPRNHADWLDPARHDPASLQAMLLPFPAEEMEATPASDYVNNARHEGPQCLPEAPAQARIGE